MKCKTEGTYFVASILLPALLCQHAETYSVKWAVNTNMKVYFNEVLDSSGDAMKE